MRITIFDYGAGNLHSLTKALARSGNAIAVETDARRLADSELLVFPGVGAFALAAERLAPGRDDVAAALADGLPCIGICLGMQLLFDGSDEGGGDGLGVIPGRVTRMNARRVPQIGWNAIESPDDAVLTEAPLETVYYANGFACRPSSLDVVRAWSTHEADRFPAMVRAGPNGNIVGVQFHPEKSSAAGVAFLDACVRDAAAKLAGGRPR